MLPFSCILLAWHVLRTCLPDALQYACHMLGNYCQLIVNNLCQNEQRSTCQVSMQFKGRGQSVDRVGGLEYKHIIIS